MTETAAVMAKLDEILAIVRNQPGDMQTVPEIARRYHINRSRVRQDCLAGRLKYNNRQGPRGRPRMMVCSKSARALYGVG